VADEIEKTGELPKGDEEEIITEEDTCSTEDIEESVKAFLLGDITLAQLEGYTAEDMYSIADLGYDLLEEGQLEEAQKIFEGLSVYNPFDPYFRGMLGTVYQRQGKLDDAMHQYECAVDLNPEDTTSWANAGEVMLERSVQLQEEGKKDVSENMFREAIGALKRAIELDPEGEDPSSLRARALIGVTAGVIEKTQKAS